MKVATGYTATAKLDIPVTVTYKCMYCGKNHVDNKQKISLVGSDYGSVFANRGKLMEGAKEDLNIKLIELSSALEYGNYEYLGLTCTCSACGKRQAWSNYPDKKYLGYSILSFFPLLISFVIALASNLIWAWIIFLCCLGFFAYSIVYPQIRKREVRKELSQLKDDEKPIIKVHKYEDILNRSGKSQEQEHARRIAVAGPIDPAWLTDDLLWVKCPKCGQKYLLNFIKNEKRCPACKTSAYQEEDLVVQDKNTKSTEL